MPHWVETGENEERDETRLCKEVQGSKAGEHTFQEEDREMESGLFSGKIALTRDVVDYIDKP